MTRPLCPNCGSSEAHELEASQFAIVDYYRCGDCAHVWTANKKTHAIVMHITPLAQKRAKALHIRQRCSVAQPAFEDSALARRINALIADVRRTRANT